MSEKALRHFGSIGLDCASVTAARQLAQQGASPRDCQSSRHTAHQAFCHLGVCDWCEGRGHSGPDVGPRRLRSGHNRLSPARAHSNEQAAHSGLHVRERPRGAHRGVSGAIDGQCDRVRRQAGAIGQEGCSAPIQEGRDTVLAPHTATHLRGLDGARRRANAENQPVSWPYFAADDRAGLRTVLTLISKGRECCDGVLGYLRTQGGCWYTPCKPQKCWWAMTGSNCRPSRCKRDALPTELIALAVRIAKQERAK